MSTTIKKKTGRSAKKNIITFDVKIPETLEINQTLQILSLKADKILDSNIQLPINFLKTHSGEKSPRGYFNLKVTSFTENQANCIITNFIVYRSYFKRMMSKRYLIGDIVQTISSRDGSMYKIKTTVISEKCLSDSIKKKIKLQFIDHLQSYYRTIPDSSIWNDIISNESASFLDEEKKNTYSAFVRKLIKM